MRSALVLLSFVLLLFDPLPAQSIWHVKQNVSGGTGDGSTWSNAFQDLQKAIAAAKAGDEIWVATGIYLPTYTQDRTASFVLKQGVRWYGGFYGNETQREQRNPQAHVVVLSGDIGIPEESQDNVYHVLYGVGVDSTTVVDGFEISGGRADGPEYQQNVGGGLLLEGAENNISGNPLFVNCQFILHWAENGGAVYVNSGTNHAVNPIFRKCDFQFNYAFLNGGAVYKAGEGYQGSYLFENCNFFDNRAFAGSGGGVYLQKAEKSRVIFRRCTFERDTALSGGGFAYEVTTATDGCSIHLDSVIFRENFATEGAGFSYFNHHPFSAPFDCEVRNCVFESNVARSVGSAMYMQDGNKLQVYDCLIRHNSVLYGSGSIHSRAVDTLLVQNTRFFHNKQTSLGGGGNLVYYFKPGQVSRIENCVFAHNDQAIEINCAPTGQHFSSVTNCTFYQNGTHPIRKTWYNSFSATGPDRNNCTIKNCIIWENGFFTDILRNHYGQTPPFPDTYGYYMEYSLIAIWDWEMVLDETEASFGDGNITQPPQPEFLNVPGLDFRVNPCMVSVNAGSNEAALGLPNDPAGQPRILNGRVDMGAYEQADICTSSAVAPLSSVRQLYILNNPSVTGDLTWKMDGATLNEGTLCVFDIAGGLVAKEEVAVVQAMQTIALGHLPDGAYLVQLVTKEGMFTGKWIKGRP